MYCQFFVLLEGLTEGVEAVPDEIVERAYECARLNEVLRMAERETLTARELCEVLLQICLCTLASRADRHGVVLVRVTRRGELIEVRAVLVLANDKETNSIRAAAVFLSVHLSL